MKRLKPGTKLPFCFDTCWDAKIGKDLEYIRTYRDRVKRMENKYKAVVKALAYNGFDAKEWMGRE